jgi:hypothetical protein
MKQAVANVEKTNTLSERDKVTLDYQLKIKPASSSPLEALLICYEKNRFCSWQVSQKVKDNIF